jgi:predicted nucleic acid-binding protein
VGRLREAIGAGPLALDTCIFIYLVEDHPRFGDAVAELFVAIDAGELPAVTSAVTLLELLVAPLRSGDAALAAEYEDLLTRGRGLTMRDLDRALLRAAAQLRAATGVRVPDALQLAAGRAAGCTVFLTNDRRLPEIGGMRVLQLAELT